MTRVILLARGVEVLVDDHDFERVIAKKWFTEKRGEYIRVRAMWHEDGRKVSSGLARFIMAAPAGLVVDHIDRNPLNNVRSNLRICTQAENLRNTGNRSNSDGFKGIGKSRKGFCARIQVDGRQIYLGHFHTPREAALAYDAGALKFHGTFACLNFPCTQKAA